MPNIQKTIMVFGTFDGLHAGHKNLFKQARNLAKYSRLVVSIARDKNVKKIKNSKPRLSENNRKQLIEDSGLADLVVLGDNVGYIRHIKKINPQIIALGYDQSNYTLNLSNDLKKAGMQVEVVRMEPYMPHIYKNSLINKKTQRTSRNLRVINKPNKSTAVKTKKIYSKLGMKSNTKVAKRGATK